jgi:hypothetical protein
MSRGSRCSLLCRGLVYGRGIWPWRCSMGGAVTWGWASFASDERCVHLVSLRVEVVGCEPSTGLRRCRCRARQRRCWPAGRVSCRRRRWCGTRCRRLGGRSSDHACCRRARWGSGGPAVVPARGVREYPRRWTAADAPGVRARTRGVGRRTRPCAATRTWRRCSAGRRLIAATAGEVRTAVRCASGAAVLQGNTAVHRRDASHDRIP